MDTISQLTNWMFGSSGAWFALRLILDAFGIKAAIIRDDENRIAQLRQRIFNSLGWAIFSLMVITVKEILLKAYGG